ncbi:ribonuclease P protein component [Culicoidibacter larvae]|uniref:Ribonuclease P protein component n=1 Tax=Culicoidibacter larvae TaxID=2579976 RepID=A0A5R8QGN7_9FIRM|nr:ribonuclease P protein component [Culicoidibacter larvae]TLG77175.1 ribonuclease P protein component [Culicoidibacter larvae]
MKRSEMIKKNEDIQAILKSPLIKKNRDFVVYTKKNSLNKNRFAILVGKKIGKAHIRNLLRRKVKAATDEIKQDFNEGFDLVIIARASILKFSYIEIKNSLENVLKKHTIIYKDKS